MKTLRDRVAVVTGANGGIGAATCIALAEAGAHIALVDIRTEGMADTIERIHALGRTTSSHQLDVRDRAAIAALPQAVLDAHGAVHVLVNNAGVTASAAFAEQSEEDFDWVLDTNLGGVVRGTRAFLPHLVRAEEAHIVNISSIFGIIGIPAQVAYCTSKFAVRGFTEALAEELNGTSIGTTVVHPGGINTGIVTNSRTSHPTEKASIEEFFRKNTISPDVVGQRIARAVLKGQERILVTSEAHLMDWLKRLLPTWGNRLSVSALVRAMGIGDGIERSRKQMMEELGSESKP
ncbi:MAG: acetoin dehydrogenase [Deltaproteobacteria bacterium]|nr:acetoin dehydrogenase [Deltaproteobacteria bacterium]HCH62509.1 acetoin dehydrogenase [Deltaproteobacteria bacterium]